MNLLYFLIIPDVRSFPSYAPAIFYSLVKLVYLNSTIFSQRESLMAYVNDLLSSAIHLQSRDFTDRAIHLFFSASKGNNNIYYLIIRVYSLCNCRVACHFDIQN